MATTLGEKIRLLRKDKGLTLEQLADKTESSKGYIWELENRETKNPSAEKLRKIADILNVTPEFLLNEKMTDPTTAKVLQETFFRKFGNLNEEDQKKIMLIIDTWSGKN